ncbi:hypothetical protein VTI28DRAFT_2723 [Corynascus sepedonium]
MDKKSSNLALIYDIGTYKPKMAVPIRIKPSDFVMPTGPAVVFVKIDREAFQYLAPSMNPLSNTDSVLTVLRKGKPAITYAITYAIHQLSDMLFGDNIAPSMTRRILPQPGVPTPPDAERRILYKYFCFYWLRYIPAGEHPSLALVELTSVSEPTDNYLDFHAVEVADEYHKVRIITDIFVDEARLKEAQD